MTSRSCHHTYPFEKSLGKFRIEKCKAFGTLQDTYVKSCTSNCKRCLRNNFAMMGLISKFLLCQFLCATCTCVRVSVSESVSESVCV